MGDTSPDAWALESSPPTLAESHPRAREMITKQEGHGLRMRVWEFDGGTPGAGGWLRVRAHASGLAIDLPGRYDDFTQYFAHEGSRGAMHCVRASANGVSYCVGHNHFEFERPHLRIGGGPMYPATGRMRRSWAKDPETVSLRDVDCARGAGFEVRTRRSSGTLGILRFFEIDAVDAYTLSVEVEPDHVDARALDVERFLSSFEP